jgi:hypothetical protein
MALAMRGGVRIDKNGAQNYQGSGNMDFIENGSSTNSCQVSTAEILVSPGDYFELMVAQPSPDALPYKGDNAGFYNWLQMVSVEQARQSDGGGVGWLH